MSKKSAISVNEYINNPKWYIITAISGNEESVIKNLKGKIASYGYTDKVRDIKLIKEKIVKIEEYSADNAPANVGKKLKNVQWKTIEKNGKVYYQSIKTEEKNKFSGYIFISMFMDDEIWFLIRNTQLVTGIVGSSGKNAKPVPISDYEIERLLNVEDNFNDLITSFDENSSDILNSNISEIYKEDDSIVLESIVYSADFDVNDQVMIISGDMENQVATVISKNDSKGIAIVEVEIFNRKSKAEINYSNLKKIN